MPHPQDVSDLTEICYLAGMIENDVESVKIPVDFYSRNAHDTFINYLKSTPADLVGISSMTGAFNNALKLAAIAKKFDKYVVMGGYHPTAMYKDVLTSPYVDAIIVGEGESTFRDLVIKGPSREVPGLAFKESGSIIFTGERPTIKDLDSLPHPLRRVRPMRFGEAGDDYSIDTIYTSRGCPWKCTFCANDAVNKKWRARSPENVVEELGRIHDPKRKKLIKIWDANFLTNIKRVEEICDLMIEKGLTNFKLWTETRAGDIVRAEGIMSKLYQVGVRHISLGIESPNKETLKLMKKKNTGDDVSRAVSILNKNMIKGQGYFIIGHYTETVEDTIRYPEYAESIGLRHSIFMVMTPYPGTAIFNEYKTENKIKSLDWDLYNNFCAVVETKGMDTKTLNKMFAYCYGRFYINYAFLNQKKSFAMAIPLLQHLLILYTIFNMKERTRQEDIKEYLFDMFTGSVGREITRPYLFKPPLLLRWFGNVSIRFRHSPGNSVDLNIEQRENSRRLYISRSNGANGVKGMTIDLDDIIELCNRVSPEEAVLLACKLEPIKNNPHGRIRNIISIMTDRKLISSGFTIIQFITRHVIKGVASVIIHSGNNNITSQQAK